MTEEKKHSITVLLLPEKNQVSIPNLEKIEDKTPDLIKEQEIQYVAELHKMLDNVIELAKEWNFKDLDYTNLIIKDKNEYTTLQQFRKLKKIQDEYLSKNICDLLIVKENQIFNTRNEGKDKVDEKKNEEVKIEIKDIIKKKKHFWNKKRI